MKIVNLSFFFWSIYIMYILFLFEIFICRITCCILLENYNNIFKVLFWFQEHFFIYLFWSIYKTDNLLFIKDIYLVHLFICRIFMVLDSYMLYYKQIVIEFSNNFNLISGKFTDLENFLNIFRHLIIIYVFQVCKNTQ